jgi:hypothetical protein
VVWQEGPFLVCHSTVIQYLVVHNCKPKNSLQNFTSFVHCCGNNITLLQSTTNLQTLKELQSLEPSLKYHHNPTIKKNNKKVSDIKNKRTKKWFTLQQPNHPTLHILGEQLGAKLRLHLLSHSKSI